MSEQEIDQAKQALRAHGKKVRAKAHAEQAPTAAARLAEIGIGFAAPAPSAIFSGFFPIRDEIDPLPLMHRLHGDGYGLALPVMQGEGQGLLMRSWRPGDVLDKVMWGIEEPKSSAPEVAPDIVFVPGLAFDVKGQRLGYGRGFYDRTLDGLKQKKKVIAIGIAYDEQLVDEVPCGQYDEPLDWILTPSGPTRCSG